jgi:hypothetical protein
LLLPVDSDDRSEALGRVLEAITAMTVRSAPAGGPRLAASDWAIAVANAVQFRWFSMETGHAGPRCRI